MNPIILLILTSLTAITLCFAAWFVGGLLFVMALCKSARIGDDAMKHHLKGDTASSIGEQRGGNEAAPLSFAIDRIVKPV
jgi:hypothetical protein